MNKQLLAILIFSALSIIIGIIGLKIFVSDYKNKYIIENSKIVSIDGKIIAVSCTNNKICFDENNEKKHFSFQNNSSKTYHLNDYVKIAINENDLHDISIARDLDYYSSIFGEMLILPFASLFLYFAAYFVLNKKHNMYGLLSYMLMYFGVILFVITENDLIQLIGLIMCISSMGILFFIKKCR